jgi:two-component system response regulator ArlR
MRVLIVEDEIPLAEALGQILRKNNYTVDIANDGESGLDNALSNIYDLIILDIMLPKMDGLSILKHIRREGFSTPVILLTARGEISDKVKGLDCGADDYLAKPFASEELLARIRAVSRRKNTVLEDNCLKFGDLQLNMSTLKLSKNDKEIKKISVKSIENQVTTFTVELPRVVNLLQGINA